MFVKKTKIDVGNLLQLILDQTVYYAIEPNLLNIFVKNQTNYRQKLFYD